MKQSDFTKAQSNFLRDKYVPLEQKKIIVNQRWLTTTKVAPLDFSCKRGKTPFTRWLDRKFKGKTIFKG